MHATDGYGFTWCIDIHNLAGVVSRNGDAVALDGDAFGNIGQGGRELNGVTCQRSIEGDNAPVAGICQNNGFAQGGRCVVGGIVGIGVYRSGKSLRI
jgi:hypothetical protein